MRKLICLLIVFAQFISACNTDNKDAKVGVAELTQSPLMPKEDSTYLYSNIVTKWLDSNLHSSAANRKLILEEHGKDDSLHTESFIADKVFITNYSSVLRWSSDSSYILDIGSYGTVPVKDAKGNVQLEGGEPDTEIALINMKTNERTRLMFVGPASTIIDGRWLDNSEAIILGTFNTSSGQTDTLIWLVNIKDKVFSLYNITT